MTNLYGLTLLDGVRIAGPYIVYGGIIFVLLVITTIVVKAVSRRRWKREEKDRLPEIVRRKLSNRDKLITSLRSHIGKQDKVIERYSVAIRAASLHNHKVSEILQMPLLGLTKDIE